MDRRRFLASITGFVSLAACSTINPYDNPPIFEGSLTRGTIIRGADFEGVIFGASEARLARPFVDGEVIGFWSPNEKEVGKFESSLRSALEHSLRVRVKLIPAQLF